MNLQLAGKHVDLGEALQSHCAAAFQNLAEKYNIDPIDVRVLFSKTVVYAFECELSFHLKRGVHVRVHGHSENAYLAFDQAMLKIDEKIRRFKKRLDDHHKHHDTHSIKMEAPYYTLDSRWDTNLDGDHPPIIAETMMDVPTYTVSEAAMRFDLKEGRRFMLFRNSARQTMNILYRRDDGNIGWIDLKSS